MNFISCTTIILGQNCIRVKLKTVFGY